MSTTTHPTTSNPPPPAHQVESEGGKFTLLLFANASTYLGDQESMTLPGPTTLFDLIHGLERRYPGFSEKVLRSSQVVRNLEYVDVDLVEVVDGVLDCVGRGLDGGKSTKKEKEKERVGQDVVINVGDEIGIVPPVSSG